MSTIVPARQTGLVPSTRTDAPTIVPAVSVDGTPTPVLPLHWYRMDGTPGAILSGSPGIPADSGTSSAPGNQVAPAGYSLITPSPAGAAFGNALGIAIPAGVFDSLILPAAPLGIDFTAFTVGLTLDLWIGGNGAGLNAAGAVSLQDGSGSNFRLIVDSADLLRVEWFAGGAPNATPGISVPGISTAPRHVRVTLPASGGGVLSVVPHTEPIYTQATSGVPDLFLAAEDLLLTRLGDIFAASGAFMDEIAMFNGVFVGPAGVAAIPTAPGIWPGIP